MKVKSKIIFNYSVFFMALLFSSCKKSDSTNNNTKNFPTPINNIVSQSMIDSLTRAGAAIYAGTTPPSVNGIYLMHTDSCVFDNSPGNFAGTLFVDYKFQFSNQDNSQFTIQVAQKDIYSGIINPLPANIYISGNGNNFSIFMYSMLTPTGITVQKYNILSGTVTSTGIQNFQNTLYLRSKGSDPSNLVAPAGTIRVFKNGAPGLAVLSSTF